MPKTKRKERILLQVFFLSFIFFLFLLFLYFFNNKYTADGPKAINGVMTVSEEDLEGDSVFYLIYGWQFYPGSLLTPSDFQEGADIPFSQTIAIGQYMDFSMGNPDRSPVGSSTYRLNLVLPETTHTYMLYLEEVFSSYHVYLDGELIYSAGNPEPDNYQEEITNSGISFTASGNTELIIAVTNQSHYYSGITFPPAFGLSDNVTHMLHRQLLICAVLMTTLAICFVLAIYFSRCYSSIRRRFLLHCLICLELFISLSYRIVFSLSAINARIWYPLELLSIYGVYLLAVLLLNDIREISLKKSKYICVPLALFCIAAVLYGFIPHNSQMINLAFQYSSRAVKLVTAAYLLYNAVSAVLYDENVSSLLLSGTAVTAVAILTDRLLPLYEPIYGYWFVEYGMLFLVLCFGFVITRNLAQTHEQQLILQEERRLLTRQLAMQKMHYQELSEKIESSIRFQHDERHLINTISSLLSSGDLEQLKVYLQEYLDYNNKKEKRVVLCLNMTVDAILQFYKHLCEQTDIKFIAEIDIPSTLPVSDIDLSILFSNLLENAYEACIDQEPEDPYIHIISRYRQDTLLLRVKNNIRYRPVMVQNGLFKSVKHEGAGVGTQSVKVITKNYDGQLKYDISDTEFQVSVSLPTL